MNDDVKFIKRSKYRKKAMKTLLKGPEMPSKIAKEGGIPPTHISHTLKELSDQDIIKCINPEVKKGRIYRLTDKGEKIANMDEFKKILNN